MKKTHHKLSRIIGVWLLPMLFMSILLALPKATYAQGPTFNVEAYDAGSNYTSDPTVDYIVSTDILQAKIINVAGFNQGDKFYFYYNDISDGPTVMDEDRILQISTYPAAGWTERTFSSLIDETGSFDFYVSQWDGRFDYSYGFVPDTIQQYMGGYYNNPYLGYFTQAGNRFMITDPFDLSGELQGDVDIVVDFYWYQNTPSTNAVSVEFSTDGGGTWDAMEDGATDTEFYGGGSAGFDYGHTFTLPTGAIDANTQFRVIQKNSAGLAANSLGFRVDNINMYKGSPMSLVYPAFVNTYTITDPPAPLTPSINISEIDDEFGGIINSGNRALPGDALTILATTANITLANYDYFIQFGDEIFPVDLADITMDQGNNEMTIDFTLPVNIPEYFNNSDALVRLLVVDGPVIDYGAGGISNRNLITYDYIDFEITIEGGLEDPAGTIKFEEAGIRQITTPAMEIQGESGATLQFNIARISEAIPPTGNEIVVEFSTNGSTWSQLGADIELGGADGVGTAGETFILDETDLGGIASPNTQFRIRQKSIVNGADVHTWSVSNFILDIPAIGGNILAESTDYNLWIGQPTFTLELTNPDMDPVYPGETVSFVVANITGEFPDYTVYEVYYGDKWLKTLTTLANFDVTIPLDEGYKTLTLRAEAKAWSYEQSVSFTIQPVNLSITDISYDYDDAGTVYNIPNSVVDVSFDMNGYIRDGLEASVMLQVIVVPGDEGTDPIWETFASLPITTTINNNQGGVISGTLPAYDYGTDTELRIYIENNPWSDDLFNYTSKFVSTNLPDGTFDNAYYYWATGITGLDLSPDAELAFNIYLDGVEEGEAQLVYYNYSTNLWDPIANGLLTITTDMEDYVMQIANKDDFIFPEEIFELTDVLILGVQYPNISTSNLKVNGIRILQPEIVTTGEASASINVIYPSVTLAELEAEYYFGESIDVQYSTFGIDASPNTWIAITLEQGDLYYVLDESDALGEVTVPITFPDTVTLQDMGFITNVNDPDYEMFEVRAHVYTKGVPDELLISTLEMTLGLETEGDFIEVAGYNTTDDQFKLEGDRFAITKVLDFTDIPEPVTLRFTYSANIPFVNPQTLPQLQVSADAGENFTTLDIPESVYAKRLSDMTSNQVIEVEIPSMYLSSSTHFRWIQEVTTSGWWTISDVSVLSGESNLADFQVLYYPESYAMDLVEFVDDPYADYDNLLAYDWKLIDGVLDTTLFTPTITVGQNLTYAWTIKEEFFDEAGDLDQEALDAAGAVIWPDTTVFDFSIVLTDEFDQDYDYTFTSTTLLDTFTIMMSDTMDIPTGLYGINARAWIYDGDMKVHGFPGWVDPDAEDLVLKAASEVESGVLIINEITNDHLEVILQSNRAVNLDETDETFYYGGEMEVIYESFGPFGPDVRLEVVLEGVDADENMVYYNLGSQAYMDIITDNVTLPSSEDLELAGFVLTENVYVKVYAYHAASVDEALLIKQIVEYPLDLTSDFLSINNGAGAESLTFDGEQQIDGVYTKRFAATRSLEFYLGVDPVTLDNHKLIFTYTEDVSISPVTSQTLPRLQLSIDAGSTFTDVEWLFESGTYELDITQEMLDDAANVNFRWIQDHPAGAWILSDVAFVSGVSNLVEDVTNNEVLIALEEVPSIYPADFSNYELTIGAGEVGGLEPPINVIEDTDFHWSIIDPLDSENIWPAGTMFEFTIDVEDPETGENLIFATQVDDGTFTTQLPDYIVTDIYTISVRAYIGEILVEGDVYEHVQPTLDLDPTAVKSVIVVNMIEEDIRKIVVDDLPNLDPERTPIPEFSIEEEVTITFDYFGTWPAGTKYTAALEQYVEGVFRGRDVLEDIGFSNGSITVKMPKYVEKYSNLVTFELRVYAYDGTTIEYGDAVDIDFILVKGDDEGILVFDQDGDRFAQTDTLDISSFTSATLNFDYMANAILENQNSLPYILVTNDGITFDTLLVDTLMSEFGDNGFLPSDTEWESLSVEIPSEFLTANTQFIFTQTLNRGVDKDSWAIRNVEVVGESNILNYQEENNDQEIEFLQPDIENYEWKVVKDDDGFEPALYNSSTFSFTWDIGLDENEEPLGLTYADATVFEFYMLNYPVEDSMYMMNATAVAGEDSIWEVTLPEDIQRDDYPVLVRISLGDFVYVDLGDYDPPFIEEGTVSPVGAVKVFNPLLKTLYLKDEVLYAGDNADFSAEIENSVSSLNVNWFYNLIVTDQWSDDWLLGAQLGATDFTNVAIPSFINGAISFEIKASIGNAMGIVGEMVEGTDDIALNNDDDFIESFGSVTHDLTGAEGDKVLLTTVPLDLTGIQSVKFDLLASDLDVTDLQKMVLEYSVDKGVTYQLIHAYPDSRFIEEDLGNWFSEIVDIPAAARTEETQIRWRIQEFHRSFSLQNINLAYIATTYTPAPMAYEAVEVPVAMQRIDIVSTDRLAYCNQDAVDVNYLIKGKFGADTRMTLESNLGTPMINGEPITLEGVTDGSGTITLNLGMLDNPLTGSDIMFRLDASDETVKDYEFDITGDYSEVGVEIIAEIPENTAVYAQTMTNSTHESCTDEERIAIVSNVMENFSYQLRNYETGALIGGVVVVDTEDDDLMDPHTYPFFNQESGALEISIGTISQKLMIEVLVVAQNTDGSVVCNTMIPNVQATFDVRPLYSLYYNLGYTGVWKPVSAGQSFELCEGYSDLRFTMGYWKNGEFMNSGSEWYRDDMTKPLGAQIVYNNFLIDGTYFAVYDDGSDCGEYQSVTVAITVNQKPDQPVITASGATSICEGESVTLTADAGYNYYRWISGESIFGSGNTQSITVTETGEFQVEVSDVPFEDNCFSVMSDPVYVDVFEFNDVWFNTTNINLCNSGDGIAEVSVGGVQEGVSYYLIDDATGLEFGNAFSGETYSMTFKTSPILMDMSFTILGVNDLDPTCLKSFSTNTLKVNILPQYHTLVNVPPFYEMVDAATQYCEGTRLAVGDEFGVTGIASGSVTWYRDGFEVGTGITIMTSKPGIYNAKYKFDDDCIYTTEDVVIRSNPLRPALALTGDEVFCSGEGSATLTAPTGFAGYIWNGGSSQLTSVRIIENNTISPIESGDYTVQVVDDFGCESNESDAITVTVIPLPSRFLDVSAENYTLCGPGIAEITVEPYNSYYSDNRLLTYQLVNMQTGQLVGDPETRLVADDYDFILLKSDTLYAETEFGILVYDQNTTTCDIMLDETIIIGVNLAEIEVIGNKLYASEGAQEYQWYRNGLPIVGSRGSSTTIEVFDDAEYTVTLVYSFDCILSSNNGGAKSLTGIDNMLADDNVLVYPNPVQDLLMIDLANNYSGEITVEITNIAGQVIKSRVIQKYDQFLNMQIETDDLDGGVYFINFITRDQSLVKSIVKQ